ncbi:hypothetical protein FKM82_014445 [Ascaphus truei]
MVREFVEVQGRFHILKKSISVSKLFKQGLDVLANLADLPLVCRGRKGCYVIQRLETVRYDSYHFLYFVYVYIASYISLKIKFWNFF